MSEKRKTDPELALMGRLRKVMDTLDPETAARVAAVLDGGVDPALLAIIGRVGKMLGAIEDEKLRVRVAKWAVNRYEQVLPLAQ